MVGVQVEQINGAAYDLVMAYRTLRTWECWVYATQNTSRGSRIWTPEGGILTAVLFDYLCDFKHETFLRYDTYYRYYCTADRCIPDVLQSELTFFLRPSNANTTCPVCWTVLTTALFQAGSPQQRLINSLFPFTLPLVRCRMCTTTMTVLNSQRVNMNRTAVVQ